MGRYRVECRIEQSIVVEGDDVGGEREAVEIAKQIADSEWTRDDVEWAVESVPA